MPRCDLLGSGGDGLFVIHINDNRLHREAASLQFIRCGPSPRPVAGAHQHYDTGLRKLPCDLKADAFIGARHERDFRSIHHKSPLHIGSMHG